MPTFVLMTKLAAGSMRDARGVRTTGRDWLHKVKECCPDVKFLAHYAILGPYDFMDLYEAPSIEAAHKVSLISRAEGAVTAESWQALPYEQFLNLLESVK